MKKLVIIDGKSVFYRGYHAMGRLALSDGTPTGGVYGFAVIAMELVKRIKPDYVVVAWDKAKTSVSKRVAIYADYKAGRLKPDADFFAQIPLLRGLIDDLGWEFLECDDFEADDIIGSLARQAEKTGEFETFIVSSDQDMLQIVSERTKMMRLLKGFSELTEVDVAEIERKYGIRQEQFLELKALAGDASDNIPGVAGVGEKTAVRILQVVSGVEELYEVLDEGSGNEKYNELMQVLSGKILEKVRAGKESAILSRKLAEIMFDAPVSLADLRKFEWVQERVAEGLKRLEFLSLVKKFGLGEYMKNKGSDASVGADDEDEERGSSGDVSDGGGEGNYASGDIKIPEEVEILWDVKNAMHEDSGLAEEIIRGKKYYDLTQARFLLDLPLHSGIFDYASGDIKKKEYLTQQRLFAEKPKVKKVYEELDLPLIPVLFKMERKGMQISREKFAKLEEEMGAEVGRLEEEIWGLAGVNFNVNSPLQLSEVLFEKLGLPAKGIKKTTRGYSTGAKELAKLAGKHEIVGKIVEHREKKKLLSTYIVPLPRLADGEGRIHTTFTQNVTSTGRLSSVNPNLQNIPVRTEEGRRIREGFEVEEGKMLVSADYAQFELRLAAALAGDEGLIADFNAGLDIHTKTAADVFGVEMEEVSDAQRRAAKVINFGVLYGMSVKGLADAAKMNYGEAERFIKEYFEVRKKIADYLQATLKFARENGYVETFYGRRRAVPDVKSNNFLVRTAAERAAMNMPIQGTEADLMKKAMILVDEKLPAGAELVCQVHDSLMVECNENIADDVAKILREVMEGVAPELPVKLAVDVEMGRNWGEV